MGTQNGPKGPPSIPNVSRDWPPGTSGGNPWGLHFYVVFVKNRQKIFYRSTPHTNLLPFGKRRPKRQTHYAQPCWGTQGPLGTVHTTFCTPKTHRAPCKAWFGVSEDPRDPRRLRKLQGAPGNPRSARETQGGPRRPQRAQEAAGGHKKPQEALGAHRRAQEASESWKESGRGRSKWGRSDPP